MASLFDNMGDNTATNDSRLKYTLTAGSEDLKAWVMGNIISDSQYEMDRVTKYHLYWKFYKGEHWRIFNDTFMSANYTRAFVNKIISFLVGDKGFSLDIVNENGDVVSDELEKAAEALIEGQWKKNKKKLKVYELLQMGSVTGDLWVQLQYLNDDKYVQVNCLDSRFSFPEFENGDINKVIAFTVRQSLLDNERGYRLFCIRYTKSKITTWYQKDTSVKRDTAKFERVENDNPYGFIPVVHIKNKPNSSDYYGFSDLDDIMKLNKVYNEILQLLKGIIDYYSTPTTVVIGGSVKSITKGLGNVWSGLPMGASVQNLTLGEDLGGTMQYLATIKQIMHELSDVPENALGKIQAISNTSAAALKITYQPLIMQADLKSITYSEGLEEIHTMMIKMLRKFAPKNVMLQKLPADFEDTHTVTPIWAYGLPMDRLSMLQEMQFENQLKLNSRNNQMNTLGLRNVPGLLDEIDADQRREGAVNAEVQGMLAAATTPTEPPNDNGQ